MDITTISSFISTVGFPCVMCILLCWYIYKVQQRNTEEIDSLKTVIESLKDAIDALKTVLGVTNET